MLTAIKQHVVVKKGGVIEITAPELSTLPEGTEVDVTAVVSHETTDERDDTTYLLANIDTRTRLLRSLQNIAQGSNLVEVTVEGWNAEDSL